MKVLLNVKGAKATPADARNAPLSQLSGVAVDAVTLHGALSPAEQAMAQSAEGAAKVQEFHRQLFLTAFDRLRDEIRRITGMNVREAGEVESTSGAAIRVLTSGTMVQVFQLSGKLPPGDFNSGDDP
jgi:uncharacterized protein YbcI